VINEFNYPVRLHGRLIVQPVNELLQLVYMMGFYVSPLTDL